MATNRSASRRPEVDGSFPGYVSGLSMGESPKSLGDTDVIDVTSRLTLRLHDEPQTQLLRPWARS
jgi:hypothetical protein